MLRIKRILQKNRQHRVKSINETVSDRADTENVYTVLTPLLLVTSVCGLSAVSLIRMTSASFVYKRSVVGIIYSCSLLVGFTTFYIREITRRNQYETSSTPRDVNASIDFFHLYTNIFVMGLFMTCNLLQANRMMGIVNEVAHIDSNLLTLGADINFRLITVCTFAYLLVELLFVGLLEASDCSMFLMSRGTFSGGCIYMCLVPLFIHGAAKCQYICYMLTLRSRFAAVNHILECLHPGVGSKLADDFRGAPMVVATQPAATITLVRVLHRRLCEAAHHMSKAFAIQLLAYFGMSFAAVTTHFYNCVQAYIRGYSSGRKDNALPSFLWGMYYSTGMFLVCYVAHQTAYEANSTGCQLHHLMPTSDRDQRQEIRFFSEHILHWRLNFSICRFFSLDLTLMHTIVASLTTYLVILIQFDLASSPVPV